MLVEANLAVVCYAISCQRGAEKFSEFSAANLTGEEWNVALSVSLLPLKLRFNLQLKLRHVTCLTQLSHR